jgi:hypothetical protein
LGNGIITREHYDGIQMIRKENGDDFTFFLSTEAGCAVGGKFALSQIKEFA